MAFTQNPFPDQSGSTGVYTPAPTPGSNTYATVLSATAWSDNHTSGTGNQYEIGTFVWYQGHVFRALHPNDSITPTIGGNTYWEDLGPGALLEQDHRPSAHTHPISDVSGLQTALDGKQPVGSYQPAGSYATAAQGAKADTALQSGAAISAISGLQTALDGKQPAGSYVNSVAGRTGSIVLTIADITNFPTLGTMSAVNDAPSDGSQYARKDAAWEAIQTGNPFDQSLNTTDTPTFGAGTFNGNVFFTDGNTQSMVGPMGIGGPNSTLDDGYGNASINNLTANGSASFANGAAQIHTDGTFWSNGVQLGAGGGAGNPFDQSLNTTDTPTFTGLTFGSVIAGSNNFGAATLNSNGSINLGAPNFGGVVLSTDTYGNLASDGFVVGPRNLDGSGVEKILLNYDGSASFASGGFQIDSFGNAINNGYVGSYGGLYVPTAGINADGSFYGNGNDFQVDVYGNIHGASLYFNGGGQLYDDSGLQYGSQSVAMQDWVQNWVGGQGYLTSEYNLFDQSLNTTDSVVFSDINLTGSFHSGNDGALLTWGAWYTGGKQFGSSLFVDGSLGIGNSGSQGYNSANNISLNPDGSASFVNGALQITSWGSIQDYNAASGFGFGTVWGYGGGSFGNTSITGDGTIYGPYNGNVGVYAFQLNPDGSIYSNGNLITGGGGGNPFNQSLNTTDNPTFAGVDCGLAGFAGGNVWGYNGGSFGATNIWQDGTIVGPWNNNSGTFGFQINPDGTYLSNGLPLSSGGFNQSLNTTDSPTFAGITGPFNPWYDYNAFQISSDGSASFTYGQASISGSGWGYFGALSVNHSPYSGSSWGGIASDGIYFGYGVTLNPSTGYAGYFDPTGKLYTPDGLNLYFNGNPVGGGGGGPFTEYTSFPGVGSYWLASTSRIKFWDDGALTCTSSISGYAGPSGCDNLSLNPDGSIDWAGAVNSSNTGPYAPNGPSQLASDGSIKIGTWANNYAFPIASINADGSFWSNGMKLGLWKAHLDQYNGESGQISWGNPSNDYDLPAISMGYQGWLSWGYAFGYLNADGSASFSNGAVQISSNSVASGPDTVGLFPSSFNQSTWGMGNLNGDPNYPAVWGYYAGIFGQVQFLQGGALTSDGTNLYWNGTQIA
jgi:hypothetical protein